MENKNFNVDEFFTKKLEEAKKEELPKVNKKSKKKNKKRKGIVVGAIALVLAGVTVILSLLPKKNNKNTNEPTKPSITQEDQTNLDDLGFTYDDSNNQNTKPQYGDTTGDIKKEDLVEKDGTIWKDKEAAEKSDDIGKENTDDKDGTLIVKPDGTVEEKDKGYEIQDEDGNKKEEGSNENGIPDGYAWDDVLGEYVKEEEVGKYVYADATYYAEDGTVVIQKGDVVLKETLEKAKKLFTTIKPQVETQPSTTPTEPETKPTESTQPTVTDEGIVNPDGTYTIYGITYKSKEDYQQFLLHPEQYGYYNGMVLPLEDIEDLYNQNQKTK